LRPLAALALPDTKKPIPATGIGFRRFQITTTATADLERATTVPISLQPESDKPIRERLPNRRACETIAFERDNLKFQMTIGAYADGRIGEIFLNSEHGNSLLDVLAHDAAILASLALQHGCTLETIAHALKRDGRGVAASPIGAAVDQIT
jgi:hypothetical protein